MKTVIKKLAVIIAALVLGLSAFSLVGCEEIKTLEITAEIYNTTDKKMEEKTLTVSLYRHLAPKTVDAIAEAVKSGYYSEDVVVYKFGEAYTSQYMLGDLLFQKDTGLMQNSVVIPTVKGEFERNGVTGSDLINQKGYVGLWRSWFATGDANYKATDAAMNSGRGTIYMPTSTNSSFDGYFCVFAKIDMDNEDNSDVFTALDNLFSGDDYCEEYTVYYTGEYDYSDTAKNNGLTFNYMKTSDFEDAFDEETNMLAFGGREIEVFKAEEDYKPEGSQLVCYNHYTVRIPLVSKTLGIKSAPAVKIKSVKVK